MPPEIYVAGVCKMCGEEYSIGFPRLVESPNTFAHISSFVTVNPQLLHEFYCLGIKEK